jgi:hypothetical protein
MLRERDMVLSRVEEALRAQGAEVPARIGR